MVYAAGSGLAAISPNVVVLFLGWSVLEGLGAALIMPTVTALVAGNFTGGVFFTIPMFLSIVLGLDAFDTGIRMLPLSLALILVAPPVPRFAPNASPRRVARLGLLLLAGAALLLAALLGENPADAGIVTVPVPPAGRRTPPARLTTGQRDRVLGTCRAQR
ncbi:MAG TPA: hypothetical protein VFH23_03080 [Jiangellaceae bacterium]|nr:hypothetical protein [Jiangellaceae bacterium]